MAVHDHDAARYGVLTAGGYIPWWQHQLVRYIADFIASSERAKRLVLVGCYRIWSSTRGQAWGNLFMQAFVSSRYKSYWMQKGQTEAEMNNYIAIPQARGAISTAIVSL